MARRREAPKGGPKGQREAPASSSPSQVLLSRYGYRRKVLGKKLVFLMGDGKKLVDNRNPPDYSCNPPDYYREPRSWP